MQISAIKNQNFEKPFRNRSYRTKVKFAYAQSLRKCSKFWRKSNDKKQNFDLIQVKKNSKLFHACVPLTFTSTTAAALQARWVYVRQGGKTPQLMLLYTGPYVMLEPGEKVFLVQIGDKADRVQVDSLKPHGQRS